VNQVFEFHRAQHLDRGRALDAQSLAELSLRDAILLEQGAQAIPVSSTNIVLCNAQVQGTLDGTPGVRNEEAHAVVQLRIESRRFSVCGHKFRLVPNKNYRRYERFDLLLQRTRSGPSQNKGPFQTRNGSPDCSCLSTFSP